ncbi:MAG: preprotein translocase subunit YajC [Acidimicrobiales bacterium]
MAASLLFLVPLALLWVLFVRPQQRRMRQAQAMVATLDVGDEIITTGGIYGTVTDTDDTSLWVEIAPDVVVRVMRGAVAQQVSPTDLDTDGDLNVDDLDVDGLHVDDDDTGDAGDDDDPVPEIHGSAVRNGGPPESTPVDDQA